MNRPGIWIALALFGVVATGGGYWWGMKQAGQPLAEKSADTFVPAERKILYYRNPMGLSDTSTEPKKDSMGMDYIPVYADELPGATAPASGNTQRRVLYYRNPMGLPDTSPEPKKDSMGMDYIPVYEGESTQSGQVKISLDKMQKLGVRTEVAKLREITRTVRAVGKFQVDERLLHTVTTKFEGHIEDLYVNATNQPVQRGQPLMQIYSPELITAQRELIFLLENEKINGAVNVSAPQIVRMKEFCKALGNAMKRPSIIPVPSFALKIALGEMSDLLLKGQKVIPEKLLENGYKFLFPEIEAALNNILQKI